MFLISDSLLRCLNKSNIESSYRSDHSIVSIDLTFNNFIKGKGLWKFNNSLLGDIEFINQIKKKISDVKKQYMLPIYNRDNLNIISDKEIQFSIDDQLFMETLLMEIRGESISYATFKTREHKKREQNIIQEIADLEANNSCLVDLDNKKTELENIRKNKMKGAMVRSRAKWITDGERPTNYFCSLENRNFINKIIPKLETNGVVVTKQRDILDEVKKFYNNLYSERKDIQNIDLNTLIQHTNINKLNQSESESLEGLITYEETYQTLKNMKNNKSPGSDGFTVEFFKCFWKQLGHFIIRAINCGYEKGELSVTQKEGIIICIPKGDKPRQFIKNWRPITLLNTIYKIASGVIASRIKTVLDKLIYSDQTGFIPGRYIGENTRLIYDIMQYTEENNIPGLLLLIDFEKAFDSVSWTFIEKTLEFFNFGPSIRKWIRTFQVKIRSAINQGGNLSSFFDIKRGCRQGDPISPYIFILCAEILAIKIRQNDKIRGISIEGEEFLISQFADDTSLILDGSEMSLRSALQELSFFSRFSGLRINYSKTQIIWIGSKKYSLENMCQEWDLQWGKSSFNLLGIDFDVDLHKIVTLNFDKRLVKLKAILKNWTRRQITPIGKITVIKSLLISQLNHLFYRSQILMIIL